MGAVKMAEPSGGLRPMAQPLPPRDEIAAHHLIDETRLLGPPARARRVQRGRAPPLRRCRPQARPLRPREPREARRRRRLHARVRAVERRGRHPDVHRGGAAAHPRQRDRGRAHRREDRRRRLAAPPRALRQPVRQCFDLGAAAHRPRRQVEVSERGEPARRHQAARRALRRAGDPPGRAPGGEGAGRPVRARAHHQGSARARPELRGQGLPVLLRHAGRGRAHAEGCRRLLRALHGRDRRHRQRGGAVRHHARRRALSAPRDVGEAVGAAPALRAGQGAPPRRGADAEAPEPGARRALARAVDHDRRGGAGPPRPDPAPFRRRSSPIRRSTAGTGSALPCRPTANAPSPCCAGCGVSPSAPASASPSASSRAPTGTARSNGRRSARSPTTPCSRASSTRTYPTSRACACCSAIPKAFYPQFATHNAHALAAAHVAGGPRRVRVPAAARHGRSALRGRDRRRGHRAPVPHLRPRRRARGAARLSRAPAPGERRQYLLRQPARRRRGAGCRDHPRPGRDRGARARGECGAYARASRVRARSICRARPHRAWR